MPFCGTWSAVTPGTKINLSIKYALGLAAGDAALSVGAVSMTAIAGADSAAASLIIGSATLDPANKILTQTVGTAFVPGVTYALNFPVVTTGGEIINFWGKLPAQAIS